MALGLPDQPDPEVVLGLVAALPADQARRAPTSLRGSVEVRAEAGVSVVPPVLLAGIQPTEVLAAAQVAE